MGYHISVACHSHAGVLELLRVFNISSFGRLSLQPISLYVMHRPLPPTTILLPPMLDSE
jgi:hypothetical protein